MSTTNSKLTRVADNIRILSAAMVEKAKSGHPGGAMGGADFMTVLYTEFLRYDPDNAMVLNNYAYFLSLEERDLEKALAMASRATALTDNNPTYLDTHAWVLFKLGRVDEARKIMQQAVALDAQESAALLVHYGDILKALGENFMAEIYWRKALEKGYDAGRIERRITESKAKKE